MQAFHFTEETGVRRIATGTSQATIQIWSSKVEDVDAKGQESTQTLASTTPVCILDSCKLPLLIRAPVVYPLPALRQCSAGSPSPRVCGLPPDTTGHQNKQFRNTAPVDRSGGSVNSFTGRWGCGYPSTPGIISCCSKHRTRKLGESRGCCIPRLPLVPDRCFRHFNNDQNFRPTAPSSSTTSTTQR